MMLQAAVLLFSLGVASAQQTGYGQCGGTNWSGETTCVSGFTCVVQNPYYSQCVPGSATTLVTSAKGTGTAASAGLSAPSGVSNYTLPASVSVKTAKKSCTKASSAVSSSTPVSASVQTSKKSCTAKASSSLPVSSALSNSTLATSASLQTSAIISSSTIQTSTPVTSVSATATSATSKASNSTSSGSFASAVGTQFSIDGVTGYFPGTNSYWIPFLTNDSDVELVMSHLESSGLKILRVWGFNDVNTTPASGTVWFQNLSGSTPTINTGADGLQRLDAVVSSAEAHGIKLIINFVNNWDDYGGITAYTTLYGGTHQTWFNNTAAQAQYQTYIKAVVSRYSNSSAIFAWELANEIRCNGCDPSVVYNWASTTSAYVKSLDPNHMVTLGDEGFNPSAGDGSYPYTTGEGVSFAQNLNISTLDFGTYHMYPTSWSVSEQTWPAGWIESHGAACAAANKPCLFEEYGSPTNHSLYAVWQAKTLATTGNSADLFWQLGDTLSTGKTNDDGYAIYYGSSDWTSVVTTHVSAINAA